MKQEVLEVWRKQSLAPVNPEDWKDEFNFQLFRVPEWISSTFPSSSWGNDLCPSFLLPNGDYLWVDAYLNTDRDLHTYSRFFITDENSNHITGLEEEEELFNFLTNLLK
jgi:hypothetical protein